MVDEQTRGIRMTCKQENIGSTINVARYDATATLSVGSMKIYWIICMLWDEKAYRVTKKMCGYFRVKDMSYIFFLFLSYKNLMCYFFFVCSRYMSYFIHTRKKTISMRLPHIQFKTIPITLNLFSGPLGQI